jgi:AcrR family transcriptional regulator
MTTSLSKGKWINKDRSEFIDNVVEVSGAVKPTRRRYHSPLRADQAEQTRRRILDAAFRLFVERGYAGTTIAAVAKEAGVSPETIYLALGSKRGLLEGVIEMAIAGEDDPPSEDDAWWAAASELQSASDRLGKMVEYSCRILARTRPIHVVIRGAADKEAFAAELGRRLLHERLNNQTERIRRHLRGQLREGLSVAQAGQRYCALTSPELYHTLTVEFGWTADQHRKWLTNLLTTELLELGSRP